MYRGRESLPAIEIAWSEHAADRISEGATALTIPLRICHGGVTRFPVVDTIDPVRLWCVKKDAISARGHALALLKSINVRFRFVSLDLRGECVV